MSKNIQQWLEQIESYHPQEIELGLDRIQLVAAKLNLLELQAKVITVGGTNGKGSCVAALESLAIKANLKVASFTSPHLLQFNERIRINGENVSDNQLMLAFEAIEKAKGTITLTFFEFTTLAALYCFANTSLELVVLEVGLGGRLDAVNLIEPEVSIITTIHRDHEAWLGSDLKNIAKEKAGIFRQSKLNIVGDIKSFDLIEAALPDNLFSVVVASKELTKQSYHWLLDAWLADATINPYRLLKQNIECALLAFGHLYAASLAKLDLVESLSNIKISGRFQKLYEHPLTILDVGHNEQAAVNLCYQIRQLARPKLRVAICGLMADKAIRQFMSALAPVFDVWIFVDLPIARAASAESLKQIHQSLGLKSLVNIQASVAQGFVHARQLKELDKQIYVIGSFVTVAEMLQYYQESC